MNRTESTELAGRLFDEVLVPLASARLAAGAAPYFSHGRDAGVESYFTACAASSDSPTSREFPGRGSAEGLIDALVDHWAEEGETALAALGPRLAAIAQALGETAVREDGSVDIFCYTLF